MNARRPTANGGDFPTAKTSSLTGGEPLQSRELKGAMGLPEIPAGVSSVGIITIAEDFSAYPAGRFREDGPYSATAFREDVLLPTMRAYEQVQVNLEGVRSLPPSFLEEAFGGLVRQHGFSLAELKAHLLITSDDSEFDFHIRKIWADIEQADARTPDLQGEAFGERISRFEASLLADVTHENGLLNKDAFGAMTIAFSSILAGAASIAEDPAGFIEIVKLTITQETHARLGIGTPATPSASGKGDAQ